MMRQMHQAEALW